MRWPLHEGLGVAGEKQEGDDWQVPFKAEIEFFQMSENCARQRAREVSRIAEDIGIAHTPATEQGVVGDYSRNKVSTRRETVAGESDASNHGAR